MKCTSGNIVVDRKFSCCCIYDVKASGCTVELLEPNPEFSFCESGEQRVQLRVTAQRGRETLAHGGGSTAPSSDDGLVFQIEPH